MIDPDLNRAGSGLRSILLWPNEPKGLVGCCNPHPPGYQELGRSRRDSAYHLRLPPP
jgi:hypothetical protein